MSDYNLSSILVDHWSMQLSKRPITKLIDNEKLDKVDGRKELKSIISASRLSQKDCQSIVALKKRLNQQKALNAYRKREKRKYQQLEKDIETQKKIKRDMMAEREKLKLEIEKYEKLLGYGTKQNLAP